MSRPTLDSASAAVKLGDRALQRDLDGEHGAFGHGTHTEGAPRACRHVGVEDRALFRAPVENRLSFSVTAPAPGTTTSSSTTATAPKPKKVTEPEA